MITMLGGIEISIECHPKSVIIRPVTLLSVLVLQGQGGGGVLQTVLQGEVQLYINNLGSISKQDTQWAQVKFEYNKCSLSYR